MAKKIHYDDNLYFLREIIKSLKHGFSVEIDNEYFADKIVDDVYFVDACLRRICTNVMENDQLIKRPEVLRSLTVSIIQYLEALDLIINKPISRTFFQQQVLNKFKEIEIFQNEELVQTKKTLSAMDTQLSSEDLVSQEEFGLLLHNPE
ncbi:MAG: hypothetical protein JW874_08670 [Spirochaetales bacterium]|nr:hypothetical protein [Spirochaetales bacterium]